MKKYNIDDLYVVKIEKSGNIYYLICKYNDLSSIYTEIFTKEKIKKSDDVNVDLLSNYYFNLEFDDKNGKSFKVSENDLLKKYIEINKEAVLLEKEGSKNNTYIDIEESLKTAALNFFPAEGVWFSSCFKRPTELKMINLPCHLRDNIWLANMFKEHENLYYISNNKVLDFVKNSSFFQEERHKYELRIVKWQINFTKSGFYMSNCDLELREDVVKTLLAMGMDSEVIEEGLERNASMWRDSYMRMAFLEEYLPFHLGLGLGSVDENKVIPQLPPIDPQHEQNWIKMRKYEYYQKHKSSVDKYGCVEPEMLLSDEEVNELKKYLAEKHLEREKEISKFKESRKILNKIPNLSKNQSN